MAYTTVADLKNYLGIDTSNDDGLLSDMISRAQKAIDNATHRVFEATADSTRYFDYGINPDNFSGAEGRELYFDADIYSITSITNGDATSVSASSYVTMPRNGTPYFGVKLKKGANVEWTYDESPEGAISVTGRWAFSATAPADIVQATIRLAAWLYKQKDTMGTEADRPIATGDGATILPSKIPADVWTLIRPYCKEEY